MFLNLTEKLKRLAGLMLWLGIIGGIVTVAIGLSGLLPNLGALSFDIPHYNPDALAAQRGLILIITGLIGGFSLSATSFLFYAVGDILAKLNRLLDNSEISLK